MIQDYHNSHAGKRNSSEHPGKILHLLNMRKKDLNREDFTQLVFSGLMKIRAKDIKTFESILGKTVKIVSKKFGIQTSLNLIKKIELGLKLRKPTLAIYDHCLHLIGGGQKYGLTVASILQDRFDISIIASKPVTHQNMMDWYNLDLSGCRIKIMKIPYYERLGTVHIDPIRITERMKNPFHFISLESARYDFFINNSMLEMVYPLSGVSAMIVHFPERRPRHYFYANQYTYIIYNSKYTASWIQNKWKFSPHQHIYPPVDMEIYDGNKNKKNIILSVARFEEGGTKKQLEMIRVFDRLTRIYPEISRGWKFILVGGSHSNNSYLKKVEHLLKKVNSPCIELKVNISDSELKALYNQSKIFWHICGLGQNDPARIEHFGMTIVEAMQNCLVPVVFDGGGQREIVDHNHCGFRIKSTFELLNYTSRLMGNPELLNRFSEKAHQKSKQFGRDHFDVRINTFFDKILREFISDKSDEY